MKGVGEGEGEGRGETERQDASLTPPSDAPAACCPLLTALLLTHRHLLARSLS